jgi:hypothetical protein
MANYLYCVSKDIDEPTLASLKGVEDAPLTLIATDGLLCITSETKAETKELSRDSALAHEKVLESVMEHAPIIPIAFGHVVNSAEEVKEKLLTPHATKLKERLSYLEDKIELSLKALWLDMKFVLADIANTSPEIQQIKARGKVRRSEAIRAGEIASKLLGARRLSLEKSITTELSDISLESKQANLFGDQMITNLAFLIKKGDLPAFDKKVNVVGAKLGENVKLRYTGPVPPFNFVDFRIDFS